MSELLAGPPQPPHAQISTPEADCLFGWVKLHLPFSEVVLEISREKREGKVVLSSAKCNPGVSKEKFYKNNNNSNNRKEMA